MKVKRVYEQVREHIEHDARQYAPGESLPSEMKYARDLDVSRLTVRKAVDDLVSIGLIRRIPGKGLIVTDDAKRDAAFKLLFSLPFVVEDSEYFQTLMGCIDMANRLGCDYKVIAFTDVRERLEAIEKENLSAYAGAVISCYESEADEQTLRMIKEAKLAVITMGNEREDAPCVTADNFNGGYLIGEYLASKGHRDILFLTSDRPVSTVHLRTEGFKQALRDNGVPVREDYIVSVKDPGKPLLMQEASRRELPPEAEAFLSGDKPFTALSGYSMLPLLSMCVKMLGRGFTIPEDVSVVGYGNSAYIPQLNLPLTSVACSNFELGARAVESLVSYLTGTAKAVQSVMVPVSMMKHHSTKTLYT